MIAPNERSGRAGGVSPLILARTESIPTPGESIRGLTPPARPTETKVALALDRPYPLVSAAAVALGRNGVDVLALGDGPLTLPATAALAEWVAGGPVSLVVFCGDPGLVCCVANKVHGVRAVAVNGVMQAARATLTVGANLLAVEMPGRTFWEARQILDAAARPTTMPGTLAKLLREMESHADR